MPSRRVVWIFFGFFLVSFLATSIAIFADRPVLLIIGLGVGAYALWEDAARHVRRLRRTR
jgi:hypothetical protein